MIKMMANARSSLSGVGPGLVASVVVAGAAGFVASSSGGPIMLFALLLGMSMNFLGEVESCEKGIAFTCGFVLRLGVALLGLKITLGDVAALGWSPLLLVLAAVSATILTSIVVARWMGFDPRFGILSGGATAICGASAAMALSAALPAHPLKQRATLFTVVGVSTLSTVAMLLYPSIARFAGLDGVHAGIFIGATIHDVAQVIGAGFAFSHDAGNTATIVKLARVAMLLPVILCVGLATRSANPESSDRPPLLPWFATAFAVLVVLNSLLPIPQLIRDAGSNLSRFFLVSSIAALGMKTRFREILSVGWKPVALMLMETIFIAGIALAAIKAGWV
jgi:uncharacterized integral membrane protein (TIGR00698 family)